MSAKEMFEKLGYELETHNKGGFKMPMPVYKKDDIYIIFWKKDNIKIGKNYIDLDLLQAINKQVEELGWK